MQSVCTFPNYYILPSICPGPDQFTPVATKKYLLFLAREWHGRCWRGVTHCAGLSRTQCPAFGWLSARDALVLLWSTIGALRMCPLSQMIITYLFMSLMIIRVELPCEDVSHL